MKTRCFAIFASCVAAVGLWAAEAKPVLEKGMSASAILQLIGKPDEVNPIKTEKGPPAQGETWIYRRKIAQTIHQTANTEATIPAMVGFDSGGVVIGKALVPDYRLKYVRAYQVTALLMVDGKLQLGRQWVSRDESFAD